MTRIVHRDADLGEDRREYLRTYVKRHIMRAMFSFYSARRRDAAGNRAIPEATGKLRMPVLALGGDNSFGSGIEIIESSKRVAIDVRGSLVPDSGQWVAEAQPDFVAEQLPRFFGEAPGIASVGRSTGRRRRAK